MYNVPSVNDCEEEILKVMYKYPKAWEFSFQEKTPNERIMKGLFQSVVDSDDRSWRTLATLQKIS